MHKKIYRFFHSYYHKNYHGTYRNAKKLFIFDLGLLALAIFMLGASVFFFFWKPGITDLVDLSLSLGSQRIMSGQRVHLTIDYTNRSKYKLINNTLAVRLPDGFIVDRNATPKEIFSDQSTFAIKDILPGAKGQADLYGWFWSNTGEETRIVSSLSYEPDKLNRNEQKISTFLANLSDSVLHGELEIASSSFPGSKLDFIYQLTNTGADRVDGVKILADWPGEISFKSGTDKLTLQPHETLTIYGVAIVPNDNRLPVIKITPQVTVNSHELTQKPAEKSVDVYIPNITSAAALRSPIDFIQGGDTIPVEISWLSESETPLTDLRLKISASPAVIDLPATAKANNLKIENSFLIVDKSVRTAFASGAAGNSDKFNLDLKVKSNLNVTDGENVYLEIKPIVEAAVPQVPGQKFEQEGNSIKIPLASEVSWRAEARYYTAEGDQLGRGPLPPQVGQTTKYWIFVEVDNTSNVINNATLTAVLPAGVEFTGKQSVSIGPEIKFNTTDRTINWNNYNLPAQSQTGLYFEVAITPTASQTGTGLTLVKNLSFTAKDSFVGKNFVLSLPQLTNRLSATDQGSAAGSAVSP